MLISEEAYDYLFKIVIIGDSGVGKSNLLLRYTADEFMEDSRSTIGVEFATKSLKIDNSYIKAQIWDTSGQERYKAITSAFYRGANGALLVYDITRRSSFEHVVQWLNELRENTSDDVPLVLIGNKLDLGDVSRAVSTEDARRFAENYNMLFFETSAYDSTNVYLAFETMFDHVYKQVSQNKILEEKSTAYVNNASKKVTLRPPPASFQNSMSKESKKERASCCN